MPDVPDFRFHEPQRAVGTMCFSFRKRGRGLWDAVGPTVDVYRDPKALPMNTADKIAWSIVLEALQTLPGVTNNLTCVRAREHRGDNVWRSAK